MEYAVSGLTTPQRLHGFAGLNSDSWYAGILGTSSVLSTLRAVASSAGASQFSFYFTIHQARPGQEQFDQWLEPPIDQKLPVFY
jgi:hypothetical protein